MKQNYDITRQMQVDLMKAYKTVCETCWSQQEAYERMVKQPAPRYYVSAKQACQVISPMLRGDFEMVNLMTPTRRRMYYSLFNEVIRLSEKRDFIGKGLIYIMREAVTRPAPEFFISPTRAKIIRAWLKNGLYDEDGCFKKETQKWYGNMRERQRIRKEKKEKWMLEKMSEETKATKQ